MTEIGATALTAAASAVAAGVVAVVITRLIEQLGGVRGGLLASVPSTIVPASLGIIASSASPAEFRDAMGAVPVGMAVSGVFLGCWRVLPPLLTGTLAVRLTAITVISLGVWALVAVASVLGLELARDQGVPPLVVGAVAFLALEAGGLWACRHPVPAPPGTRPVGLGTLIARSLLAAAAIGCSALLAAAGNPLLAGLATAFPALFLTSMVSLWWSQGEAVPGGAVGPMILGSGAVSGYALLAALLLPAWGPIAGPIASWFVAVGVVTVPAWWWLTRRTA